MSDYTTQDCDDYRGDPEYYDYSDGAESWDWGYEHEDPIDETSHDIYFQLERIRGVLYLTAHEVHGIKHLSQDWGEAEFFTDTFIGQPTEFAPQVARRAWALGRDIRNGETREYTSADFWPDDDEESEE